MKKTIVVLVFLIPIARGSSSTPNIKSSIEKNGNVSIVVDEIAKKSLQVEWSITTPHAKISISDTKKILFLNDGPIKHTESDTTEIHLREKGEYLINVKLYKNKVLFRENNYQIVKSKKSLLLLNEK